MAISISKFILRTAIASTLLGSICLDCAFAAPAKLSVGGSAVTQATVSQAAASGLGWTAVEQLIQTSASKSANGPSHFIDYQEMSLRCLGKKDWDSLTVSQRSQFVASLKSLVEKRYYPRWHKIFGKGKVTFQEEVSQGGDIIVRTKLLLGKKEELLSWRVAGPSGSQKIISLSVSNSDLLERLKSRIKARQKKVGFEALLAWMKGHSNEEMTISSGNTGAGASNGPSANNGVLPIAAVRSHSLTAAAASSISD